MFANVLIIYCFSVKHWYMPKYHSFSRNCPNFLKIWEVFNYSVQNFFTEYKKILGIGFRILFSLRPQITLMFMKYLYHPGSTHFMQLISSFRSLSKLSKASLSPKHYINRFQVLLHKMLTWNFYDAGRSLFGQRWCTSEVPRENKRYIY